MSCNVPQGERCVLSFSHDCVFTRCALEDFDNSIEIHRCAPYKLGRLLLGLWVIKDGHHFIVGVHAEGLTWPPVKQECFGTAKVTAINSFNGMDYFKRCPVLRGSVECMRWCSESVEDLREEGWLTQHGIMQFRVYLTINADALQSRVVSQWCPQACASKLWHDREYTDFSIVVQGNQELRCHRAVLSAASPVFKRMLSGDWEEALQTLERPDVSLEEMSLLLEYIYLGFLPIDIDAVVLTNIAQLADYYQLPELMDQCASRITPLVHKGNIVEVLSRLSLLSQTIPRFEILLHSAMEEVKSDGELLYTVCTNLQKPVSNPTPSVSAQVEAAEKSTGTHFSMCTSPPLVGHSQEEGSHDGCPGSNWTDECQSVLLTFEGPSAEHACFPQPPPGLSAETTPHPSKEVSCQTNTSSINEEIVDGNSSGESVSHAGEPFDQEGRAQASATDGHAEPCQHRGGPRRKTRRGRGAAKSRSERGRMDLNSIPDTYTSWE